MAKLSKELWFYVIGWMLRVGSLGICNLYSGLESRESNADGG
jgi:hypothetical protein